ncbi:MAG: polyribonucleotide nucleotidyltransferase [Schaalia hyovaginalis]|uniref:polyribonucleotide nucleotidyltransferase n=2 Tax=Schaalia hyovaginalis TaxID=29316 RepID=UPI0012B29A6C|nr:polyribonucleotide nucleotidyltransferase [Schaalia hyovaginalis]MCF2710843.1 polyribonucleotide nucleotidyltransferase [Schaalia hyovaginalis]MCI6557900.1 polyribonucleotide nucleotidyltransferase [Schaalia hyovaginalis]MCI7513841.1 polyribonucleotide nucleotidyltransferase [Schaalia hyovaginalis]MDD7553224.1 polyribonucleotide nucleotidyltransferase [Schaalia hyovaginalis]MDY3093808.1 polyribonucleotide nucleotidyltransferase [Schaalia hyovaginalis]
MMEGSDIIAAEAIIDNGRFGKRTVRFETGRLAKQAAGSALAYLDDETTVLSATTVGKNPKDQFDFFPLTVDVEERAYAAGRIPGSFFRREGRAGTEAILAARLIDRPLRPGFVKGLRNEVQVVETVLTVHPDDAYDVLAINAASMSTQIAGLPFTGPIGGTRLALIDGQWVAFPRWSELERSVFNIVVAGRIVTAEDGSEDVAIMMVEAGGGKNQWDLIQAGATAPTEDVVADGLEAAKPFIKVLCEAQIEVAKSASKETAEFPLFIDYTDEQYAAVESWVGDKLAKALLTEGKLARDEAVDAVKAEMLAALAESHPEQEKELKAAFRSLEKYTIRQRTLREEIRMDGRTPRQIRSLSAEVEVLPRVHGSALFQRGETQILGVTTLAMLRMEQQLDNLSPVTAKRYMHQYNFAPFSTGETGRVGAPKRREIGHGDLAERALIPVLPSREEFPYAIRQVSETMGSNGSSSMGSVCASTLSLLQAGVPLRAPVAGIAMGLMTGEVDGVKKAVTLTDILGAEDGFGDMDFKVAGTKDFITALQLDTKLDGIDSQVLRGALAQARDARLEILNLINMAIDGPDEMSPNAPRIITVQVPVDKIGEVIGPKGKMINQIQEDTGADVTIEDDGTVYIASTSGESAEAARQMVNQIANPQMPEVGERFIGTVVKTTSFGAFVSLTPGKDGLLHISQVRRLVGGKRVESVEDVLQVGQQVEVEIAEIGDRGKLSLHAVLDEAAAAAEAEAAGEEKSERPERAERRERSERRERRPRTRTRRKREDEGEAPASDPSED